MIAQAQKDMSWTDAKRFWGDPRLSDVEVHSKKEEADREMGDEIALFNFYTGKVHVHEPNLVQKLGAEDLNPVESHEVGHPSLAPYDFRTSFALVVNADKVLRNIKNAKLVENLFTDMIVNTHMFRHGKRSIARVYHKLSRGKTSGLWQLYMNGYERLWGLSSNSLTTNVPEQMQADAKKLEDIINGSAYDAGNWGKAVADFARVCKKYLDQDAKQGGGAAKGGGKGSGSSSSNDVPLIDSHSPQDFLPYKVDPHDKRVLRRVERDLAGAAKKMGKARYKRVLKGLNICSSQVANRMFYKDLARMFCIDFVNGRSPASEMPYTPVEWLIEDDPNTLDMMLTLMESPVVIPEYTTMKWLFNTGESGLPNKSPYDLLIVMDSSGSMPNPLKYLSIPVLGAMVCAKSALEIGRSVGIINFSSRYTSLPFSTDYDAVAEELCRYHNGCTDIPGEEMEAMVQTRDNCNILVITDTRIDNLKSQLSYLSGALGYAGGIGAIFMHNSGAGNSKQLEDVGYKVFRTVSQSDLLRLCKNFAKEVYQDG